MAALTAKSECNHVGHCRVQLIQYHINFGLPACLAHDFLGGGVLLQVDTFTAERYSLI